MQAQSHALYLLDNVASASSRSPGDWVVKLRKQLQAWPKYKTSQGIQLAASKTYQTYIYNGLSWYKASNFGVLDVWNQKASKCRKSKQNPPPWLLHT